MRLQVAFAVFAITASSGWAAGLDMLSTSGQLPDVQVVELDDAPLALLDEVGSVSRLALPGPSQAGLEAPGAPEAERVARLPRHLLLPDGALRLSLEPTTPGALEEGVLAYGRAPVLPEAPAAAPDPARTARLPAPEPAPARAEPAASGGDAGAAPAPAAQEPLRVFEPPRSRPGGAPTVVWVGGLVVLLGAAGAGVLLYHRIRPNAALENETRKTIFDAVCAQPGLGVHEISKLAGVSYSTATYHLERLIDAGMIVMTPDGNKLCFYKNGGAFSEAERRILPLIKNDEAAKLFEAIATAPGTYRAALAEKLGVTATTINWHLRRLREAGLVDETRAGRSAHLYAKLEAIRPTLLTLAGKLEPSEPAVAERLRRLAGQAGGAPAGGIAGA